MFNPNSSNLDRIIPRTPEEVRAGVKMKLRPAFPAISIAAPLPALGEQPRRIASTIFAALLLCAPMLGGCASITEGTTQPFTVMADPPAASCSGSREGVPLFSLGPRNHTATVSKSRHAIDLTCTADGFDPAHLTVDSSVSVMGAVGVGIDFGLTDYATGALNKYPDSVTVTLKPKAR